MQSLIFEEIPRLNKKILLVDDYPPTRQLIREALNQAGYNDVDEAENGREALDKFADNHFDLVISDVMMPGMGGMELLNRLREVSPDTSVIMITAYPAEELTVSAMKKGAVDFLKKPFNIDDLLYKIDIYLNEKTLLQESQKKSNIAEIQIKDKTKELSVHGYIYDSFEKAWNGDSLAAFGGIIGVNRGVGNAFNENHSHFSHFSGSRFWASPET